MKCIIYELENGKIINILSEPLVITPTEITGKEGGLKGIKPDKIGYKLVDDSYIIIPTITESNIDYGTIDKLIIDEKVHQEFVRERLINEEAKILLKSQAEQSLVDKGVIEPIKEELIKG